MSKLFTIDYLYNDLRKLFGNPRLKQVISKIVDEKIVNNDGVDGLLIDTKINANNTTLTSAINAGIPAQVSSAVAATPLKNLSDVIDYTPADITNGYLLTWDAAAQEWKPAPGAAARGAIRLFVAEKASNANVFYFNAITVTALSSAAVNIDTAFMVTSNLLTKVTIDLRSDINSSNPVRIDLYKNGNGTQFATATVSFANDTKTLTQYSVVRYEFTGLTLNQYDSLHIKVTPTTNPGNLYGIVTIE